MTLELKHGDEDGGDLDERYLHDKHCYTVDVFISDWVAETIIGQRYRLVA